MTRLNLTNDFCHFLTQLDLIIIKYLIDNIFKLIKSSQDFDPIIYLQILKKTIETFDASKNIKNKIIKKIDLIIKLLQKNKSKSAINKIKQLSKDFSIKTKYQRDEYHKKYKDAWYNNKHKKQKLSKEDADQLLQMLNKLLDNIKI